MFNLVEAAIAAFTTSLVAIIISIAVYVIPAIPGKMDHLVIDGAIRTPGIEMTIHSTPAPPAPAPIAAGTPAPKTPKPKLKRVHPRARVCACEPPAPFQQATPPSDAASRGAASADAMSAEVTTL